VQLKRSCQLHGKAHVISAIYNANANANAKCAMRYLVRYALYIPGMAHGTLDVHVHSAYDCDNDNGT
jgi:hypothetical protein